MQSVTSLTRTTVWQSSAFDTHSASIYRTRCATVIHIVSDIQSEFACEALVALKRAAEIFGNSHGDRVVCRSLMNPVLKIGRPMQVVSAVESFATSPGKLWTEFKRNGGISKADDGGSEESDQHEALLATWKSITQPTRTTPQVPPSRR